MALLNKLMLLYLYVSGKKWKKLWKSEVPALVYTHWGCGHINSKGEAVIIFPSALAPDCIPQTLLGTSTPAKLATFKKLVQPSSTLLELAFLWASLILWAAPNISPLQHTSNACPLWKHGMVAWLIQQTRFSCSSSRLSPCHHIGHHFTTQQLRG